MLPAKPWLPVSVGALCVFGIAGNVLSLVVLGRDQTIRRTTGFLLQMLAVADTAFLVSYLFTVMLYTAVEFPDWLPVAVQRGSPYIYVYWYPIATITCMTSKWMVVVLTADRYVAICRPLHAAQYSTLPRLRRAVIVLWLLAVAYSLPVFFETELVEVKPSESLVLNGSDVVSKNLTTADTHLNRTQNSTPSESHQLLKVQWSAMFRNQVYQVVYRTYLDFVVRYLLPLAALVFFNQRLVHALRKSDQLRRHSAADGEVACITDKVREVRLRWFGHVQRREEEDCVRRILEADVHGQRSRGRQIKRWINVVKCNMEDLRLHLKDVENRAEWRRRTRVADPSPEGFPA